MNLLQHKSGRQLVVFAFYFAEGAPIGFIWWAMPTLMRQSGIGVDVIGAFTAILILPWVFKFLWAPLVDVFRSSRFGFTKWIGLSQTFMCLTLLPLVFIPLKGNIEYWGLLLLLHSFCAATQDVSVDSLVINVVAHQEKGMLNGYMQAGMLLGRSLFGGGTLFFASKFGLPATIGLMIFTISSTMLLLPFIKEPASIHTDSTRFLNFKNNLHESFRSKQTWYAIAFALTAAAAFEATGGMAGPFLTDQHISTQSIGFLFGVPVVISMLTGGLFGGFLSDKISRKNAVAIFLSGFVAVIILISILGILKPNISDVTWMTLFTGMYFFIGMFTAASYALFMDITNPKLGATQFSTYMAATNGCEAWVVLTAGMIAQSNGYPYAFLAMCLVSLLSLLLLWKLNHSALKVQRFK